MNQSKHLTSWKISKLLARWLEVSSGDWKLNCLTLHRINRIRMASRLLRKVKSYQVKTDDADVPKTLHTIQNSCALRLPEDSYSSSLCLCTTLDRLPNLKIRQMQNIHAHLLACADGRCQRRLHPGFRVDLFQLVLRFLVESEEPAEHVPEIVTPLR